MKEEVSVAFSKYSSAPALETPDIEGHITFCASNPDSEKREAIIRIHSDK
jgi:hypothetical protein